MGDPVQGVQGAGSGADGQGVSGGQWARGGGDLRARCVWAGSRKGRVRV
jgi:hypothetical protein